jgi:hypothetical protein
VKVYKVVRCTDYGLLVSAVVRDKAMVVYTPGETAYPPEWLEAKGYGLLAFRTLKAAMAFKNRWTKDTKFSTYPIYRGHGKPIRLKQPLDIISLSDGRFIRQYNSFPAGTVMLETITLEKEVK